ncbi:MAG: cytochrome c family protein [Salaquimonas sp.]
MKSILGAFAFVAVLVSGTNAFAMDGDAVAGEKVFKKCAACHLVDEPKNKVGPHLDNLFGRKPGGLEDYKYSKGMIAYGEDKVWDDATLTEYLAAPKKVVKGTKMSFAGLKKEEDIANVIAYLKGFSEEAAAGETAAEGEAKTETAN